MEILGKSRGLLGIDWGKEAVIIRLFFFVLKNFILQTTRRPGPSTTSPYVRTRNIYFKTKSVYKPRRKCKENKTRASQWLYRVDFL